MAYVFRRPQRRAFRKFARPATGQHPNPNIYPVTLTQNLTAGTVGGGASWTYTPGVVLSDLFILRTNTTAPIPATMAEYTTFHTEAYIGFPIAFSNVLSLGSQTWSYAYWAGALIADVILPHDSTSSNVYYKYTTGDKAMMVAALNAAFPVGLSNVLNIAPAQSAAYALAIATQLNLFGNSSANGYYQKALAHTIALHDNLQSFFGGTLTDTSTFTAALAPQYVASVNYTQNFSLHETLSNKLLVQITSADTINLADADILQMLFNGGIQDGLNVTAAYVAPNGNITTWAINTRTGATTEYQNYNFNSFAQMGNKFLGASPSGLYELDGDTDDGADVIGTIRGGYAQFGGSKFTSFKGAYLGLRGDGDYVLRLIDGTDTIRDYAVTQSSMRTAKINLGKGLRSRYFAWELISTGQDFDLDSVEFIPITAQRRV